MCLIFVQVNNNKKIEIMKHSITQKNFDKAIELGIYEVTSELPLTVTYYKSCGRTQNLEITIK